MKSRAIIMVCMVIALLLVGGLPSNRGMSYAAVEGIRPEAAPKPTVAAATQPPPPPVETGANAPLVCGAIVLLIIVVGGVVLNVRLRKSNPADH